MATQDELKKQVGVDCFLLAFRTGHDRIGVMVGCIFPENLGYMFPENLGYIFPENLVINIPGIW